MQLGLLAYVKKTTAGDSAGKTLVRQKRIKTFLKEWRR
jgi:hypothetical protein